MFEWFVCNYMTFGWPVKQFKPSRSTHSLDADQRVTIDTRRTTASTMPALATVVRFFAFMSLSVFFTPSSGQLVLSGLLSHPLIKPIQQGISIPGQVTQAAQSMLCNQPVTALLGKLATVRASQLCQDFSLDRPSLLKCTVVDLADQAAQSLVSVCRRHEQAPLRSTALDGKLIRPPAGCCCCYQLARRPGLLCSGYYSRQQLMACRLSADDFKKQSNTFLSSGIAVIYNWENRHGD